jgi:hypothetical protein
MIDSSSSQAQGGGDDCGVVKAGRGGDDRRVRARRGWVEFGGASGWRPTAVMEEACRGGELRLGIWFAVRIWRGCGGGIRCGERG